MKKNELRKKYKALRQTFSNNELESMSQRIIGNLISRFDLTGKNVSVFLPITRFNEINSWLLINQIKANYYLPVMGEKESLKHVLYEGMQQLKLNSWGILEPQYGTEINSAELDFVIVPMLTFDSNGYRVGYGKGYYDKFLVNCRTDCVFIGVYQFDEFEIIDDIHGADVALDYCITPNQIIEFKK